MCDAVLDSSGRLQKSASPVCRVHWSGASENKVAAERDKSQNQQAVDAQTAKYRDF
jgi:hypothetical protein